MTPEALAPFRTAQAPRPAGDPAPLPYLFDEADQRHGGLAIAFDVLLTTALSWAKGANPHKLSQSHARFMYWTAAQMVAHHASSGCDLSPGDILGSVTISGPDRNACGSLLEATEGGRIPIQLETGEERTFLEDGDELILRASCRREGFVSIGFGECRAILLPSQPL